VGLRAEPGHRRADDLLELARRFGRYALIADGRRRGLCFEWIDHALSLLQKRVKCARFSKKRASPWKRKVPRSIARAMSRRPATSASKSSIVIEMERSAARAPRSIDSAERSSVQAPPSEPLTAKAYRPPRLRQLSARSAISVRQTCSKKTSGRTFRGDRAR